ncbi:methyltransferase family protein [Sphingomonas sp.]|uniref:methyltransferase family protein n=1 Tax=Sphingomonas sp. TaxID=28214 RepID=UPI003CC502F5
MIFHADPTGLPALAALALGFLVFFVSLLLARTRRVLDAGEAGATRSPASVLGIALQGLGIGTASFGPQRVTLDPLSPAALMQAALVAVLMAGAVALFFWASRTMGRNWSLRARVREDHQLVTDGPFAWIRHPIYTAMLLFTLALAVAFGHPRQLLIGLPIFALGTMVRVRAEEALLRGMFGAAYDAWAVRVKRFVPGVL